MKDPYAEIELQLSRTIDYLSSVVDAKTDADYGNLYLKILQALEVQMCQHNQVSHSTDHICSDQIMLHVQDRETGHVYCRSLPLDYEENNNGILLTGEDLDAQEVHISFLSDTALRKINDLLGQGPDSSPCEHE